jgi:hypothetical protein
LIVECFRAWINPTERLLQIFTDTASASTDQLDTLNDLTKLNSMKVDRVVTDYPIKIITSLQAAANKLQYWYFWECRDQKQYL